jgi:alkylated DNA repair dioxygenase AlkB
VRTFFDCVLCNHYPDGNSACKFHTDPEHGSHWHRTTAVVSCGTSRRFAFRPIPDISTWSEWDSNGSTVTKQTKDEASCAPAVIQLFPGDVVLMTGTCNDLFHHAVYASPFDDGGGQESRVSLVFKRALDRGGGRKGHSFTGEGRRARRNKK